jgi:hypothetical protein
MAQQLRVFLPAPTLAVAAAPNSGDGRRGPAKHG